MMVGETAPFGWGKCKNEDCMSSEPDTSVSLAFAGSGGAGVMTAANMLIDAAAKSGLYALFGRSSGPQIRGGEAAALLRLSTQPVSSVDDSTDILIAIDWGNVDRFSAELALRSSSVIIADPDAGEVPAVLANSGARIAHLPMDKMAKAIPGGRPNMIALGAVAVLIGVPVDVLIEGLGKSLKKKRADAYEASVAAVRAGAEAAKDLGATRRLGVCPPGARWAITGNEAAALGAVRGGVRFCAAYPITPGTEILEWLSGALPKIGGVFVQAEDELASINMCLGASFGGVPALTATAGPGLALMIEGLGLGVASETPVVVVDVQRGGPSTGIPTKSEQSDLDIALHGLHGDAPHLVLAAQSIGDCLFTTQWAVTLAEALQTVGIVLTEQSLGQSRAVIDPPADSGLTAQRLTAETPDEDGLRYQRYALTPSGVSPMAIPGTPGCQYTADGLEHSVYGNPSSAALDHEQQLEKRRRKLDDHDYGDQWATIEGTGRVALITWGSTTGAAHEAIQRAKADGLDVRLISPRLLLPARPREMQAALDGVDAVLVVEQSHSKQFLRYLRSVYTLPAKVDCLFRAGPLAIRPGEIHHALMSMGSSS